MVSYHEALEKLQAVALKHPVVQVEKVSLADAVGRVLAENVFSSEPVPSFNNSAMDGFAIHSERTVHATIETPAEFLVAGEIAAGDWLLDDELDLAGLQGCFEIMTGAPMPLRNYDAVVKVEDVQRWKDDEKREWIRVTKPVMPGENVRPLGTDIQEGQEILEKGSVFSSEMILAAAACGISSLPVYRKPRVAILSTGSELTDFESPRLEPGKIRNSTGPYLERKLQDLGLDVHNYGLVPDEPEGYRAVFEKVLKSGADLILTTGAVSMGKYDFIIPLLKKFNAVIHFHKVAIRPGKPIVFAEIPAEKEGGSIPLFGMPGNPVSTAVALRFFVTPFVRESFGLKPENIRQAKLQGNTKKPEGMRCFYKGRTFFENGEALVEVIPQQASYMVGNFKDVDSWVILPEEGVHVPVGQVLPIYSLGEKL